MRAAGGPKELGAKKDERKSDLGKTTEANRPAPLNSDLGAGSLRRSRNASGWVLERVALLAR